MKKYLVANLVAGLILLTSASFTVNAQDKKKEKDNNVHIKIEKEEDGTVTKIDTTVTKEQLPALKEYLKEKGVEMQADEDEDGNSTVVLESRAMGKDSREKFRDDMQNLREDMARLKKEMRKMEVEINSDGEEAFNFDFNMPPMPPTPPHALRHHPHIYMYKDKDDDGNSKRYSYSYSFNDDNEDVPDSLNDSKHIIIRGNKGEAKPELEKVITGKNGEQIFVYKRKLPKSGK